MTRSGLPPVKEVHPLAALVPVRADAMEVSVSIAQEGQHEPVVLYEKKIIEGRVRYSVCVELGIQPQFKDWVLFGAPGDENPIDWMVRRHVATHDPTELELIRLLVNVMPTFREMQGQTNRQLYEAVEHRLSWNKIRALNWLEEVGATGPVVSGEKDIFEAARSLGLAPDKRGTALGVNYGAGDKFDVAALPIVRYLKAWKRKGYEFRHLNPKEAQRRVSLIESLVPELNEVLVDLRKRAVTATLSAPPERRTK